MKHVVLPALAVLGLVSGLALSCKKSPSAPIPDDEDWRRTPVPVVSVAIPESVALGEHIYFTSTCQTPNPCWRFSHMDMVERDFDVWVVVHAKEDPDCISIPVFGSTTVPKRMLLPARGTYRFRFWQTPFTTLDTTVVVR